MTSLPYPTHPSNFFGYFGVPVADEKVAGSEVEAEDIAERTGFPVVVKGLGAKLTHRTKRNLVRLNLRDRQGVTAWQGRW